MREQFFCYRLLVIMWFLFKGRSKGFPLPLGAWDRLRFFYRGTPSAFHIIILKFGIKKLEGIIQAASGENLSLEVSDLRTDTNQAVQSQKMASGLKIRI